MKDYCNTQNKLKSLMKYDEVETVTEKLYPGVILQTSRLSGRTYTDQDVDDYLYEMLERAIPTLATGKLDNIKSFIESELKKRTKK